MQTTLDLPDFRKIRLFSTIKFLYSCDLFNIALNMGSSAYFPLSSHRRSIPLWFSDTTFMRDGNSDGIGRSDCILVSSTSSDLGVMLILACCGNQIVSFSLVGTVMFGISFVFSFPPSFHCQGPVTMKWPCILAANFFEDLDDQFLLQVQAFVDDTGL